MREITYAEALNLALREEMARDETVFLMGEDIGAFEGSMKVTRGLLKEFGPDRVMDTPLCEAGFVGAGVGAAIAGCRPVVEVMSIDWITLALDMLVNHAAKLRYMTGGQIKVPLVVRAACGAGRGMAAQHSQSLEAWLVHVPGLKVVMPSTPYDARGLLKAAIRDDNPVVFIEHRSLYFTKEQVPEEEYVVPLGQAEVKRVGGDVTVVATAAMVPLALKVAAKLSEQGVDLEIIDPRTLRPLDVETILTSLRKTRRLVAINEGSAMCGFASEIAAIAADQGFDYLDAPVKRITAKETPIPFNARLEAEVIVSERDIIHGIEEVVGRDLS